MTLSFEIRIARKTHKWIPLWRCSSSAMAVACLMMADWVRLNILSLSCESIWSLEKAPQFMMQFMLI